MNGSAARTNNNEDDKDDDDEEEEEDNDDDDDDDDDDHNNNNTKMSKSKFLFYNFLTAPRTVSNTYAQVAKGYSCVTDVQTHRGPITFDNVQYAVCYVVRRDSSAVQFDRAEIAFVLAVFRWLEPFTDEGEEEPEKSPDDELQKMQHTKAR